MSSSLDEAFARVSPRLNPRRMHWPGVVIHTAILVLWLVLFARAFFLHGVVAWSTGIAYIIYDTLLLIFVAIQSRALAKYRYMPVQAPGALSAHGPSDASAAQEMPALGVIVASHNEASVLPITLAGLFRQQHGPAKIVIADDGSTDDTSALLTGRYGLVAPALGELSAASLTHPTLYWLRLPHGGKARALNAAIVTLDTDVIMTVDADTRLADDATLAMRRAFAVEPELVAATGIIAPVCARTISGRLMQWFQTYEYIRNFIARFAWMRSDSLLLVSGAFAGFRRTAVTTVGGFDTTCLTEDYELIHRLHRYSTDHGLGWRVRVLGDAQALTDAPGTLPAFMRQRRRWFAGFLQTQYWNRDMIGNSRYGMLGTLMLPVKSFDTFQPLYGLIAFVLLISFLIERQGSIVLPVFGIVGAKILFDFAFHLWTIHLYRRWTGDVERTRLGWAVLIAVVEPFSFQLLRHVGATLGWFHFLTGARGWGAQTRSGLRAPEE